MNSFAAGLSLGIFAVLLAGALFATDGLGLLSAVAGDPVGALDAGEVVIGTFALDSPKARHVGVLVYASTPGAAKALLADVEAYRPAPPDLTPRQVREALCQHAQCDNRTGTERLLDDMQVAMDAIVNHSALAGDEGKAHLADEDGSVLVIALASADPGAALDVEKAAPHLDVIHDRLQAACENVSLDDDDSFCGPRYVRFSARGGWDASLGAFADGADGGETVLGPLSWATTRLSDAADAVAPRGRPTFVPPAALLLPLAMVALAIAVQELAERKGWNPFVPLPPLAVLASLLAIGQIALHPGDPRVPFRFGSAAFVLLGAWLASYRLLDLAGVQFFSSVAAGAAALAVVGALLLGVRDILGMPVETLVASIYDANASSIAQATVVRALAAAAAVSVAALVIALVASLLAYREGRDAFPQRDLEHALDREKGGVWRALHRLDPASASGVSHAAFASVVARFYGRARRAQGPWWVVRDAFGTSPETENLRPGLLWAPVPGAPRPGEDPMDVLWWRHSDSARRGRGR